MSDIKSLFETKLRSKMQNVPGLSLIFANVNNLVWQEAPPPDASDAQNALAYVTNADDNGDGKIDTIYFNMGNIRRALQQNGMNPSNPTDQDMDYLLGVVGEILAHEYGHIQDYKPGQENPFPGGEQAADQYAHTVMEQMKNVASLQKEFIKLANNYDQGNKSKEADALDEAVKYLNNNNSIKDLVRLANNLDRLNLTKEADLVDNILKKAEQLNLSKKELEKLFSEKIEEKDFEGLFIDLNRMSDDIIRSHKDSAFQSLMLPVFIFNKLSKFFTEETRQNMEKIRKEIFPIFSKVFEAVNDKEEQEDRERIDFLKEFTKKSDEFKEHISSSKDNIKVYGELLESFKKYLEDTI